MISVEEALKLIKDNTRTIASSQVAIAKSLGGILQRDMLSSVNLPLFDQSSMDGYAIRYSDFINNNVIKIKGEVAAGSFYKKKLNSGDAIRIYTGAALPEGLDTVVVQEKVRTENGCLIICDPSLKKGANIRIAGSQIKKGEIALSKGTFIRPGTIGYMAAMGKTKVKIISKPVISIIVTGSELIKPGDKLSRGQIYESNSYLLVAVLESIGLKAQNILTVKDDEKEMYMALKNAVHSSDLVIVTGGISVGDYDFTEMSLKKIGVKNIFYKVKQRPGKPLFFGKYRSTLIFGLPGNPAAVLSCFYEYVFPALKIMQGFKEPFLSKRMIPIGISYDKKNGLAFFLKGKIFENIVYPLDGQESFNLSSFAIADCLIYLPEVSENIEKGQLVEVHILP